MSLPFADKPEESRVYTDLKTLDLSQLSQDQFNILRQSMESQGVNGLEDEYRRLVLLQMAGNAFPTGPLNQSKIVVATVTDTSLTTLYQPNAGEVWRLIALSGTVVNRSGTIRSSFYFKDGTNEMDIALVDATSSVIRPMTDTDFRPLEIYVTNDVYMAVENSGTSGGTFDSINWLQYYIRIR